MYAGLGAALFNIQEKEFASADLGHKSTRVSPRVADVSDPHGQGSGCSSGLADAVCPIASNALIPPDSNPRPKAMRCRSCCKWSKDPLAALNKSVPSCDIKKGAEGTGGTVG